MSNCCDIELIQVPGSPGSNGSAGANGLSAIDYVQASFVVPAIGDSVGIIITDNSRFAVGQPIFIEGAGIFSIDSSTGSTVITCTYLDYVDNTHTGETIAIGSLIVPSGTQPTIINPFPLNKGGTGAATASGALINLGLPSQFVYGSFLLNGTTPVTVAATDVTANSVIAISLQTVGGTVGAVPAIQTKTAGVGFTVKGTASDTSTYSFMIIG